MVRRQVSMLAVVAAALPCLALSSVLHADTYTYTGLTGSTFNGPGQMSITLDLTLSHAALLSLPTGTDVTADIAGFSIDDGGFPPQDAGGFPAADFSFTGSPSVQIGTDAAGNITYWDITQNYFVSYPAFSGENPNDFFATYQIVSKTTGDQTVLTLDNDAGLAPGSTPLVAPGSWSPTFDLPPSAPEPATLAVLGLPALALLRRRKIA